MPCTDIENPGSFDRITFYGPWHLPLGMLMAEPLLAITVAVSILRRLRIAEGFVCTEFLRLVSHGLAHHYCPEQ